MFRFSLFTICLLAGIGGSTAFAFTGTMPTSPVPAIEKPAPIRLVQMNEHPGMLPRPIWEKYSKRPSAYANTGARVLDPAFTVPLTTPFRVVSPRPPKAKVASNRKYTSRKVSARKKAPSSVPVSKAPAQSVPPVAVKKSPSPSHTASTAGSAPKAIRPSAVQPSAPTPTVVIGTSASMATLPGSQSPAQPRSLTPVPPPVAPVYSQPAPPVAATPEAPAASDAQQATPAPQTSRTPQPVGSIAPDITPAM